ncbi:LysR family transcriptional regulator [Agrobacterium vitis]|uniref:LysR family transcriptional regulator n=1 Tax=Agrobacterium vitis TaxID=373 RepID=A0AAE4WBP1_AGRVI|nr:LysR substrate-binding domain-containing protein [Agrobacterium vitis]MCF1499324.1 LysR family transcriptional regulator [Allorhizobium sp. Av2]MCM2439428.1 LysR family transcriptional regulator [Agrobacterium vitis]MUZ57671.1 LysR family transcriptional regulator [Agrobacterium vitis]
MTSPVSFGALRTFVEVGRQGSIKRAAFALNVTPGAVSQQIKALELRFGIQLLERGNREVRLSTHGLLLFGQIAPGFEQIDAAVHLFEDRRPGPQTLVISTVPSFAACWLTPRLGHFTARHPQIEVQIETSVQLADLANGPVDLAIRHGSGKYLGLDATLLFTPRLVAVGSPSLLENGVLQSPGDCLRYPLLQDRERTDWPSWLEAQGVKPTRSATKGPSYADDALLIQAAIAGQGLAIVRDVYAARALQAGGIMLAIDAPVPTPASYFIVVRSDRTSPKIAAFRQWIMREAGVA